MGPIHIQNQKISDYFTLLVEYSRPPSKGGNKNANHRHLIKIDGQEYSFFALGFRQWIYKEDTVSFDYEIRNGYMNIIKQSIVTRDKHGNIVVRGNRNFKPQLRSVPARLPASRREQRD